MNEVNQSLEEGAFICRFKEKFSKTRMLKCDSCENTNLN